MANATGKWVLSAPIRGIAIALHVDRTTPPQWNRPVVEDEYAIPDRGTVVVQGQRSGRRGNLAFITRSDMEWQRVNDIVSAQEPCLLTSPSGIVIRVVLGEVTELWKSITFATDKPERLVTIALKEVAE